MYSLVLNLDNNLIVLKLLESIVKLKHILLHSVDFLVDEITKFKAKKMLESLNMTAVVCC